MYMQSLTWAIQTVLTVGGPEHFSTDRAKEESLQILWMIVGLCFYSFLIVNLFSLNYVDLNIKTELENKEANMIKSI